MTKNCQWCYTVLYKCRSNCQKWYSVKYNVTLQPSLSCRAPWIRGHWNLRPSPWTTTGTKQAVKVPDGFLKLIERSSEPRSISCWWRQYSWAIGCGQMICFHTYWTRKGLNLGANASQNSPLSWIPKPTLVLYHLQINGQVTSKAQSN